MGCTKVHGTGWEASKSAHETCQHCSETSLAVKGCGIRRSLDNQKIKILYSSSKRVRGGSGELKGGLLNFSLWDGYGTNQSKKFTVHSLEGALIYWSESLSFLEILMNWRSTLEEPSWSSRREMWNLAPWEEHSHATELAGDWLAGISLAEKKLRAWWTSWTGSSSVSLQQLR